MSTPWLKFYPTDWRSDPRLRMCGMAARGLWIEMIALMHEASPYGHLLVSGQSPTDAQLAVLAGAPSEQIPELIGELESAGVFSRTGAGVIYSRKMTRMAKKAAVARKNGKNGGNPSLSKQMENSTLDNQNSTNMDKPKKPEARDQKEKTEPIGSAKKRASRLPEDWTLPSEWRGIAIDMGFPADRIDVEADKMRDWSRSSKNGAKLDWLASWRNWIRGRLEDNPSWKCAPPPAGPQPVTLNRDDPLVQVLERIRGKPLIFGQRGTTSVSPDEYQRAKEHAA